ncbi:MAG: tRNA (adenosine(37)-N6)-threonylcarbamoyltransferase complex ATPase subunit type 1 TsaE [Myxococcota bacterium]|nr:tRNA (adenosine(37)-N6)-threonylcarbamoyltransferase complex ATPase subunit type 1 TsaE [Myxococcota bacterium]
MSTPEPPRLVYCWTSPGPEATREAARELARTIGSARAREPFVVALIGQLGAGKTLFTQGLAEGLGVEGQAIVSPTFTIISEYSLSSGGRLVHVDLYRLEAAAELDAAGFVDLLEPGNVLAVEWADRFPTALPCDRLEVTLERPGLAPDAQVGKATPPATSRQITAFATGAVAGAVLTRWERVLASGGLDGGRG